MQFPFHKRKYLLYKLITLFYDRSIRAQVDGKIILLKSINTVQKLKSYKTDVYESCSYFGIIRFQIIKQKNLHDLNGTNPLQYKFSIIYNTSVYNGSNHLAISGVQDGNSLMILDSEENTELLCQQSTQNYIGTYFGKLQYPNTFRTSYFSQSSQDFAAYWIKSVTRFSLLRDTIDNTLVFYTVEVVRSQTMLNEQTVQSGLIHSINLNQFYIVGFSGSEFYYSVKINTVYKEYDFTDVEIKTHEGATVKKMTNYVGFDSKELLRVNRDAPLINFKKGYGKNNS